jgi:hypothetical protein
METYTRKSKFTELKNYCHMAKADDFMEVTEWYNGEGFDFTFADGRVVSMTYGQLDCLNALVNFKG